MKKVLIDILVTTILFILLFGILKRILLDEKTMTPVFYEGLFFFLAYGLFKILTPDIDGKQMYCL